MVKLLDGPFGGTIHRINAPDRSFLHQRQKMKKRVTRCLMLKLITVMMQKITRSHYVIIYVSSTAVFDE